MVLNDEKMYYSWIQRGPVLISVISGDEFGTSVFLSDDGSVLVVGSPKYDKKGKYNDIFKKESGRRNLYQWDPSVDRYEILYSPIDGNACNDSLGDSVFMSG